VHPVDILGCFDPAEQCYLARCIEAELTGIRLRPQLAKHRRFLRAFEARRGTNPRRLRAA
jgi:hypothetical protein